MKRRMTAEDEELVVAFLELERTILVEDLTRLAAGLLARECQNAAAMLTELASRYKSGQYTGVLELLKEGEVVFATVNAKGGDS